MNAEKYNVDRIYFSGYFIRGKKCFDKCFSCLFHAQGMQLQLPPCLTQFDSGAEAQKEHYFFDMKVFCKRF